MSGYELSKKNRDEKNGDQNVRSDTGGENSNNNGDRTSDGVKNEDHIKDEGDENDDDEDDDNMNDDDDEMDEDLDGDSASSNEEEQIQQQQGEWKRFSAPSDIGTEANNLPQMPHLYSKCVCAQSGY